MHKTAAIFRNEANVGDTQVGNVLSFFFSFFEQGNVFFEKEKKRFMYFSFFLFHFNMLLKDEISYLIITEMYSWRWFP